jgi:hypothetical protein
MESWLKTMTAACVGCLLALLLFEAYKSHSPAPASVPAPAPVPAPVVAAPAAAPASAERERLDEQARALIARELGMTSGARTQLTECYVNYGEWRVQDCGVRGEDYQGELLSGIKVEPDGTIVAQFRAAYGAAAGEIRLTPQTTGANVVWRCTSPSYPDVARIVANCSYTPG